MKLPASATKHHASKHVFSSAKMATANAPTPVLNFSPSAITSGYLAPGQHDQQLGCKQPIPVSRQTMKIICRLLWGAFLCNLWMDSVPAFAQNLITNGGFEIPAYSGNGDAYSTNSGFTLPGWTFPTNPSQFFIEYGQPTGTARYLDGRQAACLNGQGTPVSISQSFPTVPGKNYVLSFGQSDISNAWPSLSELTVTVAGQTQVFNRLNDTGYVVKRFQFTAISNFSTVQFTDTTPPTTPPPPSLVSPGTPTDTTNTISTLTPTFTWLAVDHATSYSLFITQAGSLVYSNIGLTGTSFNLSTDTNGFILQPGTNYIWYMTSFNQLGNQSTNSPALIFQVSVAPTVQTLSVSNPFGSTWTFTGSVNPNGLLTYFGFQYGPTTNYESGVNYFAVGNGTTTMVINGAANLTSGHWHFRATARNDYVTVYGSDIRFVVP